MNEFTPIRLSTIYILKDNLDAIRYVGITVKPLAERLRDHIADAKRCASNHRCKWLRSLDQPPVIESVEITADRSREIFWIAHFRSTGCNLVNSTDGGEGALGHSPSEATRLKRSVAVSIAQKKRYADGAPGSRRGKLTSDEHREKIRIALTGKKRSPETCAKMSKVSSGKKLSEETKAKLSIAGTGRVSSEETRAKLSKSKQGHIVSQETRAKISATKLNGGSTKGRPCPEEVRAKISAAKLKSFAEKRAMRDGGTA